MQHDVSTRVRSAQGRAVAVALAGSVVLAGCAGGSPAPSPPPPATPTAEAGYDLPDHAAGRAAAWLLDLLNGEEPPTLTDADLDRFDEASLAEIGAAELEAVLAALHGERPWTPTDVAGDEDGVVVRVQGSVEEYDMSVVVGDDERIITLWFGEPAPAREEATSWQDLVEEVGVLDGETSLYAARVEGDRCVPAEGSPAGTAPGSELPIGSMIKLYVLGAVVDAVEDGDLTWEADVTVTDDLRSLPSGRLQDEPAGTTVTVREAALDMIRISDNTATDLLMEAVGRDRVEQALAGMGMADPAGALPVPTTRELFHLGWGGDSALHTRWRDGDEDERREVLAGLPAGPPTVDATTFMNDPVWPLGIDWFATAEDLCAAHVALQQLAGTPAGEPVRDILSEEPGVDLDADRWAYVGYKGGSAPGTMGGSWYAEDVDGQGWVVVFQSASLTAARAVPGATMIGIGQDALHLLP